MSTKAATEASEKTIVIQFRLLQERRKYQAARIIRRKHIEGLNERENPTNRMARKDDIEAAEVTDLSD